MKPTQLTFDDLKLALEEIRGRYPKFTDDELFVVWFLRAYVTGNDDHAANSVIGESKDKGIDALLIDDAARAVFVVQAKYRQKLDVKGENRADVMSFAEVVVRLTDRDEATFQQFLDDTSDLVSARLREARKKVCKEKYLIWLYFVTTGKVSPSIRKDVLQLVRKTDRQARIEVIGGKRAMLLFRDYLDGVAPPIPALDLEMENLPGVRVNGVAQRFDDRTKVESWVFSMRGDAMATLYEEGGPRLFARNIRGFLGNDTAVNEGMVATLRSEPERFFYYNNGVTIICDEAEKKSSEGRDYLQVGNPQVINGQQTTRTLAAFPQQAAKASVLVKVIRVPRADPDNIAGFEELVSRVVQGTNWQNAITPSDLISNDRRQIELERALRKIGYLYLRKREKKGEAQALEGGKQFYVVKKDQFAQAVAGCDLDPVVVRSGKERLFEEEYYLQVFPNSDPDFYLPRYHLLREVTYCAKGVPERGYAKWMVLNFMWSQVAQHVRGHRKCRVFRTLCERQADECVVPLSQAIDVVFIEALRYYRENRGQGETALDISTFFRNRKGHHKRFGDSWAGTNQARREKFTRCLDKVCKAIDAFDQ
jgi:hypothetical protein